jgi:hypothetical protein
MLMTDVSKVGKPIGHGQDYPPFSGPSSGLVMQCANSDSEAVLVRFHATTLKAIDKFAASTREKIGRPEAIRRLVELGLGNKNKR